MTKSLISRSMTGVRLGARIAALTLVAIAGTACSALDVNNPTTIQGSSLDNAQGATYLWTTARVRFADASNIGAFTGGLLADEFWRDQNPLDVGVQEVYLDRRESALYETYGGGDVSYAEWQVLRRDATLAMARVRAYALPSARGAQLGELFALRGYSALRLAEDICPGFPLRELDGFTRIYGPPLTTDEAFTSALAEFDSALVYADSVRVKNFARLGKSRTLLGLGRFAEAGATAAGVTDGYVERLVPTRNRMHWITWDAADESLSNQEGTNGLPFLADTPRVMASVYRRGSHIDTAEVMYTTDKYPQFSSPITVANDIEARLIQAEAALNAHDGSWLTILNDLRASRVSPALPALTDPGSFDAQVDLLFRERAFWLFATGHRLGDLRRLMRHYGRAAETVFPTGNYRGGGQYGTATSMPFNGALEHAYNTAITGCTSR